MPKTGAGKGRVAHGDADGRPRTPSSARRIGELVFATDPEGPLLAYNHLPNTAGTSMRRIFRKALPEVDRKRVRGFPVDDPARVARKWARVLAALDPERRRRLRYVAGPEVGHVVAALQRPAVIFALLREPVDLVLSAARRLDGDPETIFGAGAPDRAWSNPQARGILAGFFDVDDLPLDAGAPDAALWRTRLFDLAAELYRFGAHDRFPDAFAAFDEVLPLGRPRYPRLNAAPAAEAPGPPAAVVEAIRAATWLDLELYERWGLEPAHGAGPEPEPESDGKVIRGRDGWLYLAHDSNRVLDQITGKRVLDETELTVWETALNDRWAAAGKAGAAYAVLVPPNQHSVYPEHLPEGIELSASRPVMQLVRRVRGRVEVPFIYPVKALVAARRKRPTYGPKDTHWTDWGAYVGYRLLCDALEAQGVALRRVRENALEWEEVETKGDLGSKLSPREAAIEIQARIRAPASRLVFDNRVRNRGRMLVYECDAAPSSAVVFGESFGYVAIKYLSETFSRLVYVHLPGTFDREIIEREKPDAIVTIINERFLISPPRGFGQSVSEAVDVKTSRGGLLSSAAARHHKAHVLRDHVIEEAAGARGD